MLLTHLQSSVQTSTGAQVDAAAPSAVPEPATGAAPAEPEAAANAASSSASADPVKALVSTAIKKAVDNAPSSASGPSDDGPPTKTIAITKEQAQALGFFNRIMFDSPEQVSAAIFAKMDPENFEDELRALPQCRL